MSGLLFSLRSHFLGKELMIENNRLNGLFEPKSIAIIGASNNTEKLGSIVIKNIINSGFEGEVIPLNPKETEIEGLKVFAEYSQLPSVPDLAVIAIPSKFVLDVLEQIGTKGTKNVVLFTAGFKETGGEGVELENKLIALANKFQMNILGPNCLGFVNNTAKVNVTFGQVSKQPGKLRYISQSGAIATSVFDWAEYSEIGFADFVTIGNKAVLSENEVLEYFRDTPVNTETQPGESEYQPIGMYLESIVDGKKFISIAREISKTNPMFVLKPGKSSEAQSAMQSHTGAIAGEDFIFDVAMKKSGVIRCDGIEDFFDLSKAFSWEQAPEGPNIAIISNAGGPAVMTSDFVAESGLKLVKFDDETRKELAEHLPPAASVLNPIDVLGDALADRYKLAIETILIDDEVDSLLIILTPQIMTQIEETATIIGEMSLKYKKPIFCSFMGGSQIAKGEKILNKYRIPSFRYPERAVKVISEMYDWNSSRKELTKTVIDNSPVEEATKIITDATSLNKKMLGSVEADMVLRAYGINTPETRGCSLLSEAQGFVSEVGYPVVLKVSSPNLLHKTDENGVIVEIDSDEKLASSFSKLEEVINHLEDKTDSYIQIQQQVNKGVEMLIGSKSDPQFGTVIMFGAGGIFANLIEDRNLGLTPLSDAEFRTLISNSKINMLLSGFRGEAVYDSEILIDVLKKLQQLVNSHLEIKELDLNPVIINREGVWAVDSKILLKENTDG